MSRATPGDHGCCWICSGSETCYQDVIGMWWCYTHYKEEYE